MRHLSQAEVELLAGAPGDRTVEERALDAVIEAHDAGVLFAVEDGGRVAIRSPQGVGIPAALKALHLESPEALRLAVALAVTADREGVAVSSLASLASRYRFLKDCGDAAQKLVFDGGQQ